jgi:integrase
MASALNHFRNALRAVAPSLDTRAIKARVRQFEHAAGRASRSRPKMPKVAPDALMQLAGQLTSPGEVGASKNIARRYRDGLIIAILLACPIRRRSLASLEIGRNLVRNDETYTIGLDPADVKTRKAVNCSLPAWLTPQIDRYIEQFRPLLPGARRSRMLWPSGNGAALGLAALGHAITGRIATGIAEHVTLHRFRHITATALAQLPGGLESASNVLTHASTHMTDGHYYAGSSLDASRLLGQQIQKLRDAASLEIARATPTTRPEQEIEELAMA